MRIKSRAKIIRRYSLTKRSFSGNFSSVAPEHTEHGAHTSEHDRRQQERRFQENELVRCDRDVLMGLDRPCDAGQERTASECEELQAEDVDAHGLGRLLVSDRRSRPMRELLSRTNTKMTKAINTSSRNQWWRKAPRQDTQHHVWIAEVEAEKLEVRNRRNAIRSMCDVRRPRHPS